MQLFDIKFFFEISFKISQLKCKIQVEEFFFLFPLESTLKFSRVGNRRQVTCLYRAIGM